MNQEGWEAGYFHNRHDYGPRPMPDRNNPVTIKADLVCETEKAMQVEQRGKRVWIPLSQCSYRLKTKATAPMEMDKVRFTIPAWLADEKDLDGEY